MTSSASASAGDRKGPRTLSLSTTTEGERDMAHDYSTFAAPLAHPGEHLREDFLPAYNLTPGRLARAMGLCDRTRIERLVRGAQPVTPDTALRLARVFGTSAEFWMNL